MSQLTFVFKLFLVDAIIFDNIFIITSVSTKEITSIEKSIVRFNI